MERKSISFKAQGETGNRKVSGYGSVFGNVDRGNDVVMPGAFAESLASGLIPKMLWNHRSDELCGVWDEIAEDAKGLRVSGRVAETVRGNDISKLLDIGALDAMSIGYKTVEERYENDVRLIVKAELWEISLVVFPMNTEATIDAVKAAEMSKRELEETLRDAGFSRAVAQKLIAGGYNALSLGRDDQETKREILALLNERSVILQSLK